MKSVIVGTAGHIDHGKSALVHSLTGKDPDRLPEEKRRGITIDLGFADLELGDVRIGFVDVPGHERFVKNMLAGAHGIDAVALVIAADEGVMPQTREHFDICRLLGVQLGLVVITKTDLVEDELITLVKQEAEELVANSFLEQAPLVTVSARSGAGLEELKTVLRELAKAVPPRPAATIPRLPVDRAFTVKGFGGVVTGTLVSGEIREGDDLELLPSGRRVRARGLQVHGAAVKRAVSGQRTAVNLAGVEASDIERGMVLAAPGRLKPVQIIDVMLEVLPDAPRALRSRARVRLHIHAAEVLGRLRILNEKGELAPGESGLGQLRLEAPVVALSHERFIIRSYSPSQTVAGGQVLDPFAGKHRSRELIQVRERLHALIDTDPLIRFATFVALSGEHGLRLPDIAARTGWDDALLDHVASEALAQALIVDCEGVFLTPEVFGDLTQKTLKEVTAYHEREPLSRGLARETLRERHFTRLPAEVFRSVLSGLETEGAVVSERDVVRASKHTLQLEGADAELHARLDHLYTDAGLEPAAIEDVFANAGVSAANRSHSRKILQLLIDGGNLIRVQGDLLFHRSALERLKAALYEYGDRHEPARRIDITSFKDLAGVSRKYAIPLLEFLDRERVTRRAGHEREILKPR